MAWKVRVTGSPAMVELTYSGHVPPEELYSALVASVAAAREEGTKRFLADCTLLEGGHSTMDLYGLISLYDRVGVPADLREAIVLPSVANASKTIRFYEETCRSRGFTVRVFEDRDGAEQWLARG